MRQLQALVTGSRIVLPARGDMAVSGASVVRTASRQRHPQAPRRDVTIRRNSRDALRGTIPPYVCTYPRGGGAVPDYINESLANLARAAGDLAFELRTRKRRTPEERRQLAETTADLLHAISRNLGQCSQHFPYTPEREAGEFVARAFQRFYEREAGSLRITVLARAAHLVHGSGALAVDRDDRHRRAGTTRARAPLRG